uniref:Uncharacterized protein n=1 Tax=Kalanchoe fedtschenkoi TaxID=63787 RepID=A0A7N0SZH3_KALFE
MVESIAATSFLGHRSFFGVGGCNTKDVPLKRKQLDGCRPLLTEFLGRSPASSSASAAKTRRTGVAVLPVVNRAMGLTKEVYSFRKEADTPHDFGYQIDTGVDRRPGVCPPENKADNPSLHNPLLRQERMGCGWLGAIFEWEGVLIEDNPDIEKQAWLALAEEEGKSPPPTFLLKRVEGMKTDQAISEVLCWSRDPSQVRRMASRMEDIYQGLLGGIYRLRNGSQEFVNVLMHYKIPMALVSTRPRKILENAIVSVGIEAYFTAIITAEDVHRGKPDPEMFIYAAQLLKFIPERCIVFGNSNQTVEAAHDGRMKCVAVASKHPVYELGAADLVVRRLDELSIVDLKNLAAVETSEFGEPEVEMELEEQEKHSPIATTFDDLR